MQKSSPFFVLGIAAATVAAWMLLCLPAPEPSWPESVAGFSFSPLRSGQDPTRGEYPSTEDLDADLALLAAAGARSVRTYALEDTLAQIPQLAARHGLGVTLGVWLDADRAANAARLEQLRAVVASEDNIDRVIIGNEVLLREELAIDELAAILDAARRDLEVPVGTAEPWHLWIEHPELARHVDFVSAHLLPYWEGIAATEAVEYVAARMDDLAEVFPDTPIVIGEVGWPSFGRSRGKASAAPADAAVFVRRFLDFAERERYDYFLLEAFDQPWKRADEGGVGAYWGVYDAQRRLKFDRDGPVAPLEGWLAFALGASLLSAAAFCLLTLDGRRLRLPGRVFLAGAAAVPISAILWSVGAHAQQYWTALDALGASLSALGVLGVALLLAVEAHEWAESRWAARGRLPGRVEPDDASGPERSWPLVSIHVPAHAEPPELLIETLRSLAALDYPRFEVVVVDNNTDDEALWRPVEACCARLGERFRFFHVAPLEGFKAGALNFALRHTAPDAGVVAVIDSDYKVELDWLRELIPQFDAPRVAIVQAPQAYRDGGDAAFKAMCDSEYRGFFHIGMVTRNDRNAIIQHGTMTLIRRSVLEEVGGWSEWTITEDAELGLRVLEHGHEAYYTPRCYGRGLTPDGFAAYKSQRYRWALGAVQILRAHRRELLGTKPTALDRGQRYHYVAGWLPWLGDGCNLLFNAAAIVWSALMIAAPLVFLPPLAVVSVFVIALFAFKLAKVVFLYRSEVKARGPDILGGAVAGLALIPVVGRAVIEGVCGRRARFCRTPKLAQRASVAGALAAALPETVFAALLLLCAAGIAAGTAPRSIDLTMWCILLTVFAVPHVAALAMSLIGALPAAQRRAAARLGDPVTDLRRG